MDNMQSIPELLDAKNLIASTQVIYQDKPMWVNDALNKALEDLTKKAVRYNKKGKIKLEIELLPGQMNQLSISPILTISEPKSEPLRMMAYTDNHGRLYGEDPAQTKLPLNVTPVKKGA